MPLLYKCTRPDGTDFRSGTIDYAAALESGEPLPELSAPRNRFPGPGWYHLATVPTECVGMVWPCRLFVVEPVGDVHRDADHPHNVGVVALRVVEERPAYEALGPQGEQVSALIDRAARMTHDEAESLYAARYAARGAARGAARYAARGAARDAAQDAARGAALDAAQDAAWGAAQDAARGAARDAALALLVRDLLAPEHYAALTGPWASVMGGEPDANAGTAHISDHATMAAEISRWSMVGVAVGWAVWGR